jgi:hypothetical protein
MAYAENKKAIISLSFVSSSCLGSELHIRGKIEGEYPLDDITELEFLLQQDLETTPLFDGLMSLRDKRVISDALFVLHRLVRSGKV